LIEFENNQRAFVISPGNFEVFDVFEEDVIDVELLQLEEFRRLQE
jgi:hypothetical protein